MSGSVARTVAVRVATDEVDSARSKLEAIGDVGDRAFARVAQSAQNAANAFARVSAAADSDAYAKRAADLEAYGAEMDRLRAKFDPFFAAQQRHKAIVAEIAQAERVGAIDANTAAFARERANRAHQEALAPMRGTAAAAREVAGQQVTLAASTGATAYQMRALAQQMPDVVQGLLGGQRPMQILVQQGGQVVQVTGGVGAAFKTLVSFVGGPWVLAFAAGALAMGGLVARSADLAGETRGLGVALRGVGKDAEIATGQLEAYIRALERQGASRADARGIVTDLARTPGLSGADIGRVTSIAPDLAAGTGTSVQEAAKQAASLFTGGYDAVRKLDDALNFLTSDQRTAIRTMLEHGQRTEALAVAFGALDKRMKGLREESLTPTKKAFEDLGKGWEGFIDAVAKSKPVLFLLEGAGLAIKDINKAISNPGAARNEEERLADRIAEIQQQIERLQSRQLPDPKGIVARQIQDLAAEQDRLVARRRAVEPPTAAATAGNAADDPTASETKRQKDAVNDLTRSYADQQRILAASIPDRVRVRAEIQAEREAADNRLTGLQLEDLIRRRVAEAMAAETDARAQELAGLDREAAGALAVARASDQGRAAMLRATAAAEAHEKAATQTGASEVALTAAILNRDAAQEASKGAEAVVLLNEQNAAIRRLIEAEKAGDRPAYYAALDERIREATKSMEARRDAATDPAIRAALQAEIDLVRQRTLEQDRLNGELDTQRKLRAGGRELEDLAQEARLVGVSADQRERELAARRALRSLGDGVDPNNLTEAQKAFVEQAKAIADANTALNRQRDLYGAIADSAVQAFDQVGSAITQAFVGGQGAAVNWGNVSRGVIASVLQEVIKLSVINPVLNATLGTSRPSLFDAAGGSGGGGFGGITQMFGLSGIGEQLGLPSFGSLFGSGGFSGLMQTPLWGGSVAGPPTAAGIAASGAPTIGGYLGGLGLGFGAGSFVGGLINPQHSTGSMVGAGVGAAIGSIWGPVGGLVGGLIGGIGGSFFGPGPAHHGYSWQIQGNGTGGFGLGDRVFVDPIAQQQFQQEQQQIAQANALLARYGVGVSGLIEIGGTAPGMGGRNANQVDSFNAGFGAFRFSAANDNKLGGFLDGRAFTGLDDLATGLSFVKETLPGLLTPLGDFDRQMKALTDTFDAAQKTAEHFGYAEDELAAKREERAADLTARRDNSAAALTASYAVRYARATGGDTQAASLAAFDAAAAQERIDIKDKVRDLGLADTEYAAARILDVEKTLAAERLAIVQQYADQSKGLLTELTIGGSSALAPEQRYFAGLSLLNQARQSFDAGGSVEDFARVAQQVLPVARDYLGTSERYASLTAEIAAAVTARTGDPSGLGAILQAQVDGTDAMRDVFARYGSDQLQVQTATLSEIRRLASTLEALIARQQAA